MLRLIFPHLNNTKSLTFEISDSEPYLTLQMDKFLIISIIKPMLSLNKPVHFNFSLMGNPIHFDRL